MNLVIKLPLPKWKQRRKRFIMSKKIGLSISACIADIIAGKVNEADVEIIIAGTSASNEKQWNEVFQSYRQYDWSLNPNEAEQICRRFISTGRIKQPVLLGEKAPDISKGHWLKNGIIHFDGQLFISVGAKIAVLDVCLPTMLGGAVMGSMLFFAGVVLHFLPRPLGYILYAIIAFLVVIFVIVPLWNKHNKRHHDGFPIGALLVALFVALSAYGIENFGLQP